MADRLPRDITTDILSRLPLKSLFHSKFVCKTWRTIISDLTFQLNYLSKTNNHPDLLLPCRASRKVVGRMYSTRINDENLTTNIMKTKIVPLSFIDIKSSMYEILILGSCKGLLCLSSFKSKLVTKKEYLWSLLKRQERRLYVLPCRDPIYVYNPITREFQELPCFEFCNVGKKVVQVVCGFGFDVGRLEFKVVFVFFYKLDGDGDGDKNVFSEVRVYTLGTDTWRKLNVHVPHLVFRAEVAVSFEFANGSLHWIAVDGHSPISKPLILSFHLGVEEFVVFPTPRSVGMTCYDPLQYCALGVLDKRLSLVDTSAGQLLDVWLVKDYDGVMSWNKQFSVRQNIICRSAAGLVSPIQVLKNGEILLFCGLTDLVAYNTESSQNRFLKFDSDSLRDLGNYFSFVAVPFVGSLISIKSIF